jgi:GNAT superfamily N-acetyltransferase
MGQTTADTGTEDDLLVRDATGKDLAALTRLKDSAALHRDRLRDAQWPTFRYLVLERHGDVIGFGCLVYARPAIWSDAQDTSHLPQIVDLLISPALRGRGYGSCLIRSLERFAAQQGFTEIFVAVNPLNNPRAHALYGRLGYKQIQTRPYVKHWEFVDSGGVLHAGDDWTVDMVKTLGRNPMTHDLDNGTPHERCRICSQLSDQEYAYQKYGWEQDNTYLPAAAGHLQVVRDFRPYGSRKLQLQRCPECGTWYMYRTDYEYLVNGSEDEEYLTRLTEEQAAEYLDQADSGEPGAG